MESFPAWSLIAALLGQPVGAQESIDMQPTAKLTHSIAGSWQCHAKNELTEYDSVETFNADGTYLSKGEMQFTPPKQFNHPTITYDVSGTARWELVGNQLYNHGMKVKTTNMTHPAFDNTINPNDLNQHKKQIDDKPSKIVHLSASRLILRAFEGFDITRCKRK